MSPSRRIRARCPRCQGRLLLERDRHGAYLSCLMCGLVLEERTVLPAAYGDPDRPVWWRAQPA
jgi:hypothetical protein